MSASEPPCAAALTIGREDAGGTAAQQLVNSLCAELSQRYSTPPSPFSPSDVAGPRATFLVARLSGVPVGCGALRRIDDATVELKRLYVAPPQRGRGIGRRLLAELERAAVEFGYRAIRLETGMQQPDALGLYESSGYQRIAAFGHYVGNRDSVCFEKRLSE
jgi:putative acetyltransferase